MERNKAIFASTVVAVGLTLSAGTYIAGSGLLAGATDNVGNLKPAIATTTTSTTTAVPASTAPQEIVVYVDPATGTATTVVPQPSAAPSTDDQPQVPAVPVNPTGSDDTGYDDHGANSGDDSGVDRDDHSEDRDDDRGDDRDSGGDDEGREDDD